MNKTYTGSWGKLLWSISIVSVISIVIFATTAAFVPKPLNILIFGFLGVYTLVLLFIVLVLKNNFYILVTDDHIKINKTTSSHGEVAENSFANYGANVGACLSSTKENILSVSVLNEEDKRKLLDFVSLYKPIIGPQASFKRLKNVLKTFSQSLNQDYKDGIGPFSMSFVSTEQNTIKIVFKNLALFNNNIKWKDVPNAIVFVTLKDPEVFLRENSNQINTNL